MREQEIEHFDFVNMDIEGGERDLFTQSRIGCVLWTI
jgi:hypothetical protein